MLSDVVDDVNWKPSAPHLNFNQCGQESSLGIRKEIAVSSLMPENSVCNIYYFHAVKSGAHNISSFHKNLLYNFRQRIR